MLLKFNCSAKGIRLFLLAFIFPALSFSQIYPVQVTTQLIPPYSGYLIDYADPGSEKLKIILQFNDFTVPQYNLKLRLEIKGNGFTIVTKQLFNPPPITIYPGVPFLLSGADLAPYLSSNNLDFIGINQSQYESGKSLPEGFYTICVRAYDYYQAGNTVVSNDGCAQAWFTLSDPPLLNLPFCKSTVQPLTPQNIVFQWTPMNLGSPNSAMNTEYDFELWEIKPDSTVNPEQLVLSTVPIYKTTTQQTLANYGIAEPELNLFMKYAWRVRARDITGKDMFKNNGYSQVCTFNYGSTKQILDSAYSLTLTAQGVTHRMGLCSWNHKNVFSKYLLQVRKKGSANWFDYKTNLSNQKVINLEPNTTYEAQVRGEGSDVPQGPWSNMATFTTLPDPVYACNDPSLPPNMLQGSPLPADKAVTGLVIQSGQFEVTAMEIEQSGAPGWYKGKGYAKVLGGFPLAVQWSAIYIDDNARHQQGVIEAMTKGINSWMHQYDVAEAEDNSIYTNGTIDSVYSSGSQVCFVLQGNTTPQCYPVPPDQNVMVIRDEEGNEWIITTNPPPTKIEGPTNYLVPSADHLDASDSTIVTFSASANQDFGFDKKEYVAFGPDYEMIKLNTGKKYFVPNKSVGEGKTDEVLADVLIKNFDKSKLSFKDQDGTALNHSTVSSTQFKVSIPDNPGSVYAWYDNKKVGKLNVVKYKPISKKLILIPVNNSSISASALETDLNNVYKQANVEWTVKAGPTIQFDLGGDGLQIPDATLMTKYSSEMRALRDTYRLKDTAYDKHAYFLFVVPAMSDPSYKGYMVRGRAVGFIAAGSTPKDAAHELGHGAFGLEHTFPQIPKATSNNMMDYGTDAHLVKKQWDEVQSNQCILNWTDGEEDAAIVDSRLFIFEILNKIKAAYNAQGTANFTQTSVNQAQCYNIMLNGVKYKYIRIVRNALYCKPTNANMIEFYEQYMEFKFGIDIDNIRICVPKEMIPALRVYLTSPVPNRNVLLFVNGYFPNQEIFTKHPDVVYQNDVWDYWGALGENFINTISTKNTVYASGNDFIWTSNHLNHLKAARSLASMCSNAPFLNTTPNVQGFNRRFNNGRVAGMDMISKMLKGTIPCRTKIVNAQTVVIDTVDVIAHSMGFAYSLGMITELQKANIHIGRFYIIAPENGCSGVLPGNLEEAWQYGTDEEKDWITQQDGIAPQCKVGGIDQYLGSSGGRVFIPETAPKGWMDCHLVQNYKWIFDITNPNDKGYVKTRK